MMMQLQMMIHTSFFVDISRRHYCCCHHSRSWKYYIKSWQKKQLVKTRYRHHHDDSSLHVMILSHGPWHHHCDSGSARRPLLMKALSDFVVRRCGRKRSWLLREQTGREPSQGASSRITHLIHDCRNDYYYGQYSPQRLIEIFPQRSDRATSFIPSFHLSP